MPKRSAGLMMYRYWNRDLEVFLVHPGGPFWAKKDLGAWSIPKGEYMEGEHPLDAARREFQEETGLLHKETFSNLERRSGLAGRSSPRGRLRATAAQ